MIECGTPSSSTGQTSDDGASKDLAVLCEDVWKRYHFDPKRSRKLKTAFINTARNIAYHVTGSLGRAQPRLADDSPRWVLSGFNLAMKRGEIVGVVGANGSGKSTLLKLLSRILRPTRGTVCVNGRLTAMIELGAGFHEDLTGRDNVYLAGSLLGMRKREVKGLYDRIVEFAELGPHMSTPLKYYSTGMQTRLGFSIATAVDPQVLLIDEVLSVGDASFQKKSVETIQRLNQNGAAVLFVSHDLAMVRSICTRAIWLKDGIAAAEGEPNCVCDAYLEHYWPGCTRKAV